MRLLYTPTEAAAALGVSRSKVYELLRAGRIKSVRIDASRRIPGVELERFVESCSGDTENPHAEGLDPRGAS